MLNKKLLVLACVFLALSCVTRLYQERHPAPVAVEVSSLIKGMSIMEEAVLSYNIDDSSCEAEDFLISGWAFIEGHSTAVTNPLICVKGEDQTVYAFTTKKIQRLDVADAYGTSLYEGAGFSVTCSMRGLPKDQYSLMLYEVDSEQKKYAVLSLPYTVAFDGVNVTLVEEYS